MAMITGAAVVDEDRISHLSDDLLHHILSFLPSTQPRVQTSLLSRRFRHLWAHHPDLHLSFLSPPHNPSAVQSYVLSVDRCLRSFASPYLRSFSIALFLPSPTVFEANSEVAADRWLRFAAFRSVRNLYVRNFYIRARSQACIPSSLFCCHRSVEDLKTTFCQFPAVPRNNFEGFSNLKKLSIIYCTVHDETLLDLLDCCPVLEILELVGCISLSFAVVSSWSLKELDLSLNLVEMGTRVDAPNLRCIQYKGDLVKLDWEGSSDLLDATLIDSGIGYRIMNLNEWKSIVSAVSSVRFLKVNCWFFQFEVPKNYANGFMFKNLKELCCDIKWLTRNVFRTLTYNLGECPVLEKLCIELGGEIGPIIMDEVLDIITVNYLKGGIGNYEDAVLKCVGKYDEAEWDPSEHFSELDYSLSHLKIITLKEFLGSKNEMRLVEFLLEKAVVLEKFIIFDLFKREEPKLRDLFVDVPRASSHVQMELH